MAARPSLRSIWRCSPRRPRSLRGCGDVPRRIGSRRPCRCRRQSGGRADIRCRCPVCNMSCAVGRYRSQAAAGARPEKTFFVSDAAVAGTRSIAAGGRSSRCNATRRVYDVDGGHRTRRLGVGYRAYTCTKRCVGQCLKVPSTTRKIRQSFLAFIALPLQIWNVLVSSRSRSSKTDCSGGHKHRSAARDIC